MVTQSLLDQIKIDYAFLFTEFGYTVSEEKYDPFFFGNAYVILASKDMRLRFISDRGQIFLQFSTPNKNNKNWHDAQELVSAIQKTSNIENQIDTNYKLSSYRNFLFNEHENIRNLFIQNQIT